MAEFFFEYGLFLAKCLTFVLAIGAIIFMGVVFTKVASDSKPSGRVRFQCLNDEVEDLYDHFKAEYVPEKKKTPLLSDIKKQNSEASDAQKVIEDTVDEQTAKGRVFLLDFDGDTDAKTDGHLEEEVNALLTVSDESDEVVVRLKSPGGYVHAYGIAAEHLKRIKEAGLKLTVCVDEIAASGGYMMACVADKIIAAPFSTIGSIGVVAGVPNVNGLLSKHGVEYEDFTAGEYKRTVTTMGEITPEGREKFQKDLETIHEAFKEHVKAHRSDLDVAAIATGESWLGRQALEKGLVDEIGTYGRVVDAHLQKREVYIVRYKKRKELSSQLSQFLVKTASSTLSGIHGTLAHKPKY